MTIDLHEHVEALHGCNAVLEMETELVEKFEGSTVWDGSISIFKVDHPDADTCYAWSAPIEGSENRKFYAVLKIPACRNGSGRGKGRNRLRLSTLLVKGALALDIL